MRPLGTPFRFTLRAAAVALALLGAAPVAVGQEPDKAAVDAWVKAGAQYGWVGRLDFRPAFAGAIRRASPSGSVVRNVSCWLSGVQYR